MLENKGVRWFFREYLVVVNSKGYGKTAVKMIPSETRFSV